MKLYSQLNYIIDRNFAENEVKIESLIIQCSLYYITVNGNIFFLSRVIDVDVNDDVASVCFVRDNHIFLLCTRNKYKGLGYAKNLLQNVLDVLKIANLNVRASNASAIGLYTSLGFRKSQIKRNYYNYSSINEDAIEMTYNSEDFFDYFFVIPEI